MDQRSTNLFSFLSEKARSFRIHRESGLRVGLRLIHLRIASGIHDDLRPEFADGAANGIRIGQVQFAAAQGHNFSQAGQQRTEGRAQLSVPAGEKNGQAHRAE